MRSSLRSALAKLPPLGRPVSLPGCKICGAPSRFFDVVDFNKICSRDDPYPFGAAFIPIMYHRCTRCDFIFTTEMDDWTQAEFARFIYNGDYTKVDGEYVIARPLRQAEFLAAEFPIGRGAKILDYGSGTGIGAVRLREMGFATVETYDPFSDPVRPRGRFEVITCFEVIEHSPDPLGTLRDMVSFLDPDGCILFSQAVQPPEIQTVGGNWWYIGPRNGHVSIYSLESLARMGEVCGLTFFKGPGNMFGWARGTLSPIARNFMTGVGPPFAWLLLGPPGDAGPTRARDEAEWHEAERQGSVYRWTRAARIGWQVDCRFDVHGTIRVSVPVAMEIQEGFAAESWLAVDGGFYRVAFENGRIWADAEVSPGWDGVVELVTPPPASPLAVRGEPDARELGLAVEI